MLRLSTVFTLVSLATLAGCSAQKDGDYEGDAQATLHGNAVLGEGAQPTNAVVLLSWNNFARNGDTVSDQMASVSGSFPAKFRLALTVLPPRESFNDFGQGGQYPDEVPIAVAPITAIRAAANLNDVQKDDVVGGVEDYVVVYADADVKPNTMASSFVHGTLTKGFHLMKVVKFDGAAREARSAEYAACQSAHSGQDWRAIRIACGAEAIFDELHEAPFETEVTLKVAPRETLDFPNFT